MGDLTTFQITLIGAFTLGAVSLTAGLALKGAQRVINHFYKTQKVEVLPNAKLDSNLEVVNTTISSLEPKLEIGVINNTTKLVYTNLDYMGDILIYGGISICLLSGGFLIYTLLKPTTLTPPGGSSGINKESLVKENTTLNDIITEVPKVMNSVKESTTLNDQVLASIPEELSWLKDSPNIIEFLHKYDRLPDLSEVLVSLRSEGIPDGSSLVVEVGNQIVAINLGLVHSHGFATANEDVAYMAYVEATCVAAQAILDTPTW